MIEIAEFLEYCKKLNVDCHNNFLQIPSAFDIETSSFYSKRLEKQACMYIWMFGIKEEVTYGRTWEEFLDFIDKLVDILQLNEFRKLVVYVHNLSYEFGFIGKLYEWKKVFALKERKVLTADNGFIQFRCSYLLSGLSLAKTAENCKTKIRKMVGDLDYDLIRNSKTSLSKKELKYCEYDIKVILIYIGEKIISDGGIEKIPLTKTGYVRNYCRNKCLYLDKSEHYNKSYKKLMDYLTLTKDEYDLCVKTFGGGYTHASPYRVDKIFYNVKSKDFTSSYPAQAVYNYYPMSKGKRIKIKNLDEFNYYLEKYCCMFEVRFEGLEDCFHYENYLSNHKCKIDGNRQISNVRVVSADILETALTEVDFRIIKKCYTWKKIYIKNFWIYKRGYLPKELVECILKFYGDKTTLKGVEGKEEEYLNGKEMVNAIYGMIVTAIIRDEIKFIDDWIKTPPDIDKEIEKYNNKRRFLFYPWGIYITAHAREYLWRAIFELMEDYLYADTDSVKYINPEKHEEFFIKENKRIYFMLQKAMEYHGLEIEKIKPKNNKGKECILGLWDDDGHYDAFKTLGAKRYIYKKHGENTKITIAGLSKEKGAEWLRKNYGNYGMFNYFTDGMYIPPDGTGKMTYTYINDKIDGVVKDYQGNCGEYHENSCIHLEKQPFELSLSSDFISYLRGINKYDIE